MKMRRKTLSMIQSVAFFRKQLKDAIQKAKCISLTFIFSGFAAKNQGLSITKNTASTTIQSEQPFGQTSHGSSNGRINVETTSINGFQTSKNELDIAMLQILDPHLRPVPPVPNEPQSQQVYKEHMDLAKEYFKVNEICSATDFSIYHVFFHSSESNRNRIPHKTQRESPPKHVTRRKKNQT